MSFNTIESRLPEPNVAEEFDRLVTLVGGTSIGPCFTTIPTDAGREKVLTLPEMPLLDYVKSERLYETRERIDADGGVSAQTTLTEYRRVNGVIITIDKNGKLWFPNSGSHRKFSK